MEIMRTRIISHVHSFIHTSAIGTKVENVKSSKKEESLSQILAKFRRRKLPNSWLEEFWNSFLARPSSPYHYH